MEVLGYRDCVGVFDSGVGGISILQALVEELPHERFCYFGDSANAPYGEKEPEEVLALSRDITERFLAGGAKAIVVACNTATSAAVATLRLEHPDVPIIGVEPALKPAVLAASGGEVLVMATPMTVSLEKFQRLLGTWGDAAHVHSVPCEGLAARIEQGNLDAEDVVDLIRSLVGSYAGLVDAVVLGCTHYPFVRAQIEQVLGPVTFYESATGCAHQLRRRLEELGLAAADDARGSVEFASSKDTPEELAFYRNFFEGTL